MPLWLLVLAGFGIGVLADNLLSDKPTKKESSDVATRKTKVAPKKKPAQEKVSKPEPEDKPESETDDDKTETKPEEKGSEE